MENARFFANKPPADATHRMVLASDHIATLVAKNGHAKPAAVHAMYRLIRAGKLGAEPAVPINLKTAHHVGEWLPGTVLPRSAFPNGPEGLIRIGAIVETTELVTLIPGGAPKSEYNPVSDRVIIRSTPALWETLRAGMVTSRTPFATSELRVEKQILAEQFNDSHQRPSPFTIPEPMVKFAEGPPSEPPPPRAMTVDGLISNLIGFADFYERTSEEIACAEPFRKPLAVGSRDAYADYMQRCFRATPCIDRVRGYVLALCGEDLTVGTARRVLSDLIRLHGLTVGAAGALVLDAAMDLLESRNANEPPSGIERRSTRPTLTDPGPNTKNGRGTKRIPKPEAEILVREWLEKNARTNPGAVTRDAVATETGVSAGMVSGTAAWKAFSDRRNAQAKPGRREVKLTDAMRAAIPADSARPDELAELIEEQEREQAEDKGRQGRRHRPS
jgi:hypothetical protein